MTAAQANLAQDTLRELKQLAPGVDWHTSYNYYTKLPEFSALKDGGIQFSMFKREWKGPGAEMEIYVNMDAQDKGQVVVWPGLPRPTVSKQIPRVNFKNYIQFVKDNIGILEQIGA